MLKLIIENRVRIFCEIFAVYNMNDFIKHINNIYNFLRKKEFIIFNIIYE